MSKTTLRPLTLIVFASAYTLAVVSGTARVSAQTHRDTGTWEPKKTPTPAAKPARTSRPAPRPVRHAPARSLLSAQYRVLKVSPSGSQITEVSPVTAFNAGDRLRFGFKTNADAYLYVIWQPGPGQPGRIFFPDSRYNGGVNNVPREQELVVPGACLPGTSPADCAHTVTGAGQEMFTFIVSRSPTLAVFNQWASAGSIDAQHIDEFVRSTGQRLDAPRRGDSVFAVRYDNANPRADDLIVLQFTLNKK